MSTEDSPDAIQATPDDGKHKPRRLLRSPKVWLSAGIATVVLIGVSVGSFFLFAPRTNTASGRTTTAVVTKGTQTATVTLSGTLSPSKQANLNFSVSGQVTKVYVKAGQTVTKGQKLATIDSSSLQDAVDLASANVTSAQANYSDISSSGTSAAKTAAKAQVTSAKASLSSAEEDLKSATIRSTMTGTVASVDISVGDQVSGTSSTSSGAGNSGGSSATTSSSSSAEIVVIGTSTWKVEGTVGATDLSNIKTGQAAAVTVDSTEMAGTVSSVGIVSTTTDSDGAAAFPVVINITGAQKNLYSGTTASAVVTTGTYADVLTVSTAAITGKGQTTVVTKIATDGSTSVVEVAVGRTFGDLTEITKGLSEGDKVQITVKPTSSSSSSGSSGTGGGLFGGGAAGGGGGGAPGGGAPGAGGPGQ
jgi:multidrug efflux pump subunit AcrA (membrane-fusion protein)